MANSVMVSVLKKSAAAGRPTGKKKYVILFDWEDVKKFEKDEKGIKVTSFEMQEGKKPIGVYATQNTIHAYDSLEGDADAKGYIHKLDMESPGNSVEMDELRNEIANRGLGAIVIGCDGDDIKLLGTPCAPLLVSKDDSQDNNEGKKVTLNLASEFRSTPLARISKDLIPETDSEEVNAYLGLPAAKESSAGLGV